MGNQSSRSSLPATVGVQSAGSAPFDPSSTKSGPPFTRSDRYVRLESPGGNVVHVLGVVPCSTLSAEEAAALIRTARPNVLYIDAPPEVVSVMRDEVRAGRLCDLQRVPEASPTYRLGLYPGVGPIATIAVRNYFADNDMSQLLGCEIFAPLKAALGAGLALSEPPSVLSFPYSLTYPHADPTGLDEAQLGRPGHVGLHLSGNGAQFSTNVGAYLGNAALLLAGSPSDVEASVEMPACGYFTRAEVSALQAKFRSSINAFAARCSAESCDLEAALGAREAVARTDGDAALAEHLSSLALRSQRQSQAVAFELQAAADALPPGGSVVAVVNAGGLASLQRNWGEARPPQEVLPPTTVVQRSIGYGVGGLAVSGVGYLVYRAGRRFPRIVGGLTVAAGGTFVAVAAFGIHSDNVRYGTAVRAALARPRITSVLTKG